MHSEGLRRLIGRSRGTSAALVVASLLALALSGCGSSSSAETSAPAGSTGKDAAAGTIPATVPPGTTLRVGDQLEFLQTILSAAGEDKDLPYKVKWAGFIGGPPMLQAFHAGAIDAGFVADTPLIFAQAAHQDVVAIAAWASEHGSQRADRRAGTAASTRGPT